MRNVRKHIDAEILKVNGHPESARLKKDFLLLDQEQVWSFAGTVDAFSHPLSQWIEALLKFYAWEAASGRTLSLRRKIAYLECCAQGGAPNAQLVSLSDLFEEYAKAHGVVE